MVVADNGSSDGSRDIALAHGAHVVEVPIRGYGAALAAGIKAAKGHYVLMGDADSTYVFSQASEFVAKLRQGYDIVMSNRFRGQIAPRAREPHLNTWRDGWRNLKFMLSFSPKYSFLPLAAILVIVAVLLITAYAQ